MYAWMHHQCNMHACCMHVCVRASIENLITYRNYVKGYQLQLLQLKRTCIQQLARGVSRIVGISEWLNSQIFYAITSDRRMDSYFGYYVCLIASFVPHRQVVALVQEYWIRLMQTVRTHSIIAILVDFANLEVNAALVPFLAHIQMEQKAAVIAMLSDDAALPLSPPVY